MGDITKRLIANLRGSYRDGVNNIGNTVDLTTWLARKISQQRQLSTSTPVLYDGDTNVSDAPHPDIQDEVAKYFHDVSDP